MDKKKTVIIRKPIVRLVRKGEAPKPIPEIKEPLGRHPASMITDNDLAPVQELLEKKENPNTVLQLTPEMIKTLPVDVLTRLIEDRRSELKQLKIELMARMM